MVIKIVVSIPVKNRIIYPEGNYVKEFRLDYAEKNRIKDFIQKIDKIENTIITIRDRDEGGYFDGSFEDKLDLLKIIKNSIIDIEFKHYDKIPKDIIKNKRIILSAHNFRGEFSEQEIFKMEEKADKKIIKIAMNIKNINHNIKLAKKFRGRIMFIDLSGNIMYRIILSFIGGIFLYTYYKKPTAPGQIDYNTATLLLDSLNMIKYWKFQDQYNIIPISY
ncbi:MAG: type I 3-dehydroquinate dehydratase [Thermoplasmata archaeon]